MTRSWPCLMGNPCTQCPCCPPPPAAPTPCCTCPLLHPIPLLPQDSIKTAVGHLLALAPPPMRFSVVVLLVMKAFAECDAADSQNLQLQQQHQNSLGCPWLGMCMASAVLSKESVLSIVSVRSVLQAKLCSVWGVTGMIQSWVSVV